MTIDQDIQDLKNAGWKIYSKDGKRRFWESPYDGKVYATTFAILAERVHQEEKFESGRLARLAELEKGAQEYEEFDMYKEGALETIVPPLDEKKPRSKKKRTKKNIQELGF